MTHQTLTCAGCGFDGARWSDDDLERTLAHTDDLIGYVVDDLTPDERASLPAFAPGAGDDVVTGAHRLMHHLHDLAAARRTGGFEPMYGGVASLHASGGGVPKPAVDEAVVDVGGIVGDTQGNRRNHGRPWQALCLWSADLVDRLRAEGHPVVAGGAGENVSIAGVDWSRMRGGLTVQIGPVVARTSGPAAPCHKIGDCFTDRHWNRIDHDERPGWARWYASVLVGGTVRPDDPVTVSA
jgi:hypothetical protein